MTFPIGNPEASEKSETDRAEGTDCVCLQKGKPDIQQLYEELEVCSERLMGYKECFEIMGKGRNSMTGQIMTR